MGELRGRIGWPKKAGFYWIQVGNDDHAQPCFYDPKTHCVLFCGEEPRAANKIGWAVIADKPLPRTTIVPSRRPPTPADGEKGEA